MEDLESRWGGVVHGQIWPLVLLGYQARPEEVGSVLGVSTGIAMLFLSLLLSWGLSQRLHPALDGEGSRKEVHL